MTGGLRREGITTTQLEYIRFFNRRIDFDIAAVHNNAADVIEEFEKLGSRVIELPDRKRKLSSYILQLYKLMRYENYDIIHVHGSSAILSIELLVGFIAGVKVRIAHSRNTKSEHGLLDKILRPLFNRLYTDAFSCGQEAGEWLFGQRPFRIIRNGKDLKKLAYNKKTRDDIRNKYGWNDKLVLGHVGNFNYQKNHEFLIDVFKRIVDMDEKYILCLIGDGHEHENIRRLVKQYGLIDRVVFTGRIRNVNKMLQALDLMLFPSRFEGLPNVVLEWQASGLPCLISANITTECAVSDLVSFLPINNYNLWIDEILKFSHVDRVNTSIEGVEKLRTNGFDIEENVMQLFNYYEAAVNN